MPIFDQGYQHWQGHLSGRALRWWAITWRGVRTLFRSRWTRIAVTLSLSPALGLAAMLIIWGLIENKVGFIQPLVANLGFLPEELRQKPEAYRAVIWTLSFQFFFIAQTVLMMLIVAIVGPDLISKDLRFNAIPLYFSRPLTRFDYFLGKLGVIGFFVALATIVPVAIGYLLGISFSFSLSVIGETLHLLVGGIFYGLIVMVVSGLIMLAMSSLTRNSRYVAGLWIGLWLISEATSAILVGHLRTERWPPTVSFTKNFLRLNQELLRTEDAWSVIDKMAESVSQLRDEAGGRFSGSTQPPKQIKVPQFGTTARPEDQNVAEEKARAAGLRLSLRNLLPGRGWSEGDPRRMVVGQHPPAGTIATGAKRVTLFIAPAAALKREPELVEALVVNAADEQGGVFVNRFSWVRFRQPWQWSAAVLAGLGLLSLFTLNSRVRSLDRLK